MQKTALLQNKSNPYSRNVTATLCKPPFGMLTKTTNFQFGSFRSPERNDSGLIKERAYSSDSYRFGFNGKEKDDQVSGDGNSYDYGFRIYNTRLGKFLSVDTLFASSGDKRDSTPDDGSNDNEEDRVTEITLKSN